MRSDGDDGASGAVMREAAPCPLCGTPSLADQQIRIRGRDQGLHHCPRCDLRFFPDPDWLDAAYADPISEIDIGMPTRCLNVARVLEGVVRGERLGDRAHLDFGGGYGLMTRFARDRGIDLRHHDPYAKNLFAQGFEGDLDARYGCTTLVEVLEHLVDPVPVIERIAAHSELVLVSTILVPPGMTDLRTWWYVLPDLGQHVTFYSERALAELAERVGMSLTSNHLGVHLLHRRPLRAATRLVLREIRLSPAIGTALRYRDRARSLREPDGAAIAAQMAGRFAEPPKAGGS